jgi:hypothetical protein
MHNKIILVIGPKGSGKSHKVGELLEEYERLAVFDIVHESIYDKCTQFQGKPREFAQAINPSVEEFRVVYRPVLIEVQDNGLVDSPELAPFINLCFKRGNMCMVIDEAHLLCNSRNCPKELMIANLIGRHRKLSMILVAQSFSGIHPAIRKNADEFYFWKIIEPSDLDGIKDRCGSDVRDQVQDLRATETDDDDNFKSAGQMLHWTKGKGVVEVTS